MTRKEPNILVSNSDEKTVRCQLIPGEFAGTGTVSNLTKNSYVSNCKLEKGNPNLNWDKCRQCLL